MLLFGPKLATTDIHYCYCYYYYYRIFFLRTVIFEVIFMLLTLSAQRYLKLRQGLHFLLTLAWWVQCIPAIQNAFSTPLFSNKHLLSLVSNEALKTHALWSAQVSFCNCKYFKDLNTIYIHHLLISSSSIWRQFCQALQFVWLSCVLPASLF